MACGGRDKLDNCHGNGGTRAGKICWAHRRMAIKSHSCGTNWMSHGIIESEMREVCVLLTSLCGNIVVTHGRFMNRNRPNVTVFILSRGPNTVACVLGIWFDRQPAASTPIVLYIRKMTHQTIGCVVIEGISIVSSPFDFLLLLFFFLLYFVVDVRIQHPNSKQLT